MAESLDRPLSVAFDERAFDFDEDNSGVSCQISKLSEYDEIWRVFHVREPQRYALEFVAQDFTGSLLGLEDHRVFAFRLIHAAPEAYPRS